MKASLDVMLINVLWISLTCWTTIVLGLPGRIHVGGLFEVEDDEQEMCFRIAVDWLNTDDSLLKNSRMVAAVEKLSSEDSFKATKQCCGLLQKGVAAVFGPRSALAGAHIQSICDDLEVPHVEARWQRGPRRDQLSVNLFPHPSVLGRAFVQLVSVSGWKDFYLVYEEDEAIIRMKDFLQEAETRSWSISMYKFPNSSSYRDVFWDIKKSVRRKIKLSDTDYRIILDVPRDSLYNVLKAAQQVGMVTEKQKYLITSLDMHTVDMNDFQYGKTNITGLRLVQEENPEFQLLLDEVNSRLSRKREHTPLKTLRTECALMFDSVKLLAMALEAMDLAKNVAVFPPISCNLMNKGIDGTSLVNYIKDGQLKGISGPVNFDVEGFRSNIQLDVMYVTSEGIKKIGTMTPGSGINITQSEDTDFEFLELENKHYRVSTYPNPPYAMLKESPKELSGNERFEGYGIDLLNELAKQLRFTYDIHMVKDLKYGTQDSQGNWNGMIGEVVNGKADMAIADLTITTARIKGVDFTLPFMQTGISILFKKPTTKVTSLFSFLSPFSGEVWILVMAAYTFISISFFLVGRLSQYEWANPHPCRQNDTVEENVFSLLNSMWFAIGSLMQQGSDIAPTAMSTRAITSIWYFFCLIMISSYTANLAAFLTVEKIVSPIENAEDLSNQEIIKYGCLASGSTRGFFQNSNLTTFARMWNFMKRNADDVLMDSNNDAIERVLKGNYAYLMEASSIEYITERRCNLTQIGGLLDTKGYGIAVMKGNHKLSAWLSGGILMLQEQGLLHTFKERWWKQKKGGGSCSEASASSGSVNELGLGNVGGVFVVMLLGLCLSAMVGVIEFFWFQRKLHQEPEMPMFKLLMREIKFAVTCGSSSKPAPKVVDKSKEEESAKTLPGYNSLF